MSVIFMAGFPYSGKTYVVNKIVEKCSKIQIISPKNYRPDEYGQMSEEDKREVDIASWECSLDALKDIIKVGNGVIVYDTSCASMLRMMDYFKEARNHGHYILYVFVKAPLEICKQRAGKNWLPESVLNKYKFNFGESILRLSKLSDKSIIIDNNEGEPDISILVNEIDRISKPK